MSSFDFAEYVLEQIPGLSSEQLSIQPLTGGFTNITIRASFEPSADFRSHRLHTAVLKYAPPFIASDPTQSLSVNRQKIEATALDILSGSDPSVPEVVPLMLRFPRVQIPRLIYHDVAHNVLWISDLGHAKTLPEFLTSGSLAPDDRVVELASQLAEYIGEVFRSTSRVAGKIGDSVPNDNISQYLAGLSNKIMSNAGISDAEALSASILQCAREKIQEPCLGMVDFWPNSVLVDDDGKCGLIDWEYFGLTTAGSELGMFIAHLHILLLSGNVTSTTAIRLFISTFVQTWKGLNPTRPSLEFKRRFLVSHGRELVNGVDLYSNTLSDSVADTIVRVGVASLRAASTNLPAFETPLILDSSNCVQDVLGDLIIMLSESTSEDTGMRTIATSASVS